MARMGIYNIMMRTAARVGWAGVAANMGRVALSAPLVRTGASSSDIITSWSLI